MNKQGRGFLTFAKNSTKVDYLELAYYQALNIKKTQSDNLYAVVVDTATESLLSDKHRKIFDHIIVTEFGTEFGAECRAFWLTPFKETIKVEADLLFTRSIDHWWTAFRLRDICLSHGCKDYLMRPSYDMKYRRIFVDNKLPNVYNGLMYFRYSETAHKFFTTASQIQENWHTVKDHLKNCREQHPSTDVLFAITALVIGAESCSMPSMDYINFVHLKPSINGYNEEQKVDDVYIREFDQGMIRINGINQTHPIHYYEKDFLTDDMKDYYGR